ncbi:hypothetical protein CR513_61944, partial [Mucuna pruriens]
MKDQTLIDAASGGALMDKTPAVARHLISNMASNMQQFGVRGAAPSRILENQLTELTSLVRKLAVSRGLGPSKPKFEPDSQSANIGSAQPADSEPRVGSASDTKTDSSNL